MHAEYVYLAARADMLKAYYSAAHHHWRLNAVEQKVPYATVDMTRVGHGRSPLRHTFIDALMPQYSAGAYR